MKPHARGHLSSVPRPSRKPRIASAKPATWSLIRDFGTYQLAQKRSAGTIRLYRYRLLDLAEAYPAGPGSVTPDDLVRILSNPAWDAATT